MSAALPLLILRIAISLVAAALLLAQWGAPPAWRRRSRYALGVVALASLVSWSWVSIERGSYLNSAEFFAYYLGSKYADEVGYTDLIDAAVVAQYESGAAVPPLIRDLRNNERVPFAAALMRAEELQAAFGDERWVEFSRDVQVFRSRLSDPTWAHVLNDRGFNASPVWTLVAARFSRSISTSNAIGLQLLPLLDVALMIVAFAAIAWAFGSVPSLVAMIFVFSSWYSGFDPMRAAFLRTDWLVCLVVATCLLAKGRPGLAGGLAAYACLCRIFPVFFAAALAGRALWALADEGRLPRRYGLFFSSFGGTAILLVGASLLDAGGVEPWREFVAKLARHNSELSVNAWSIGFREVFTLSYRYSIHSGGEELLRTRFEDQLVWWWALQAVAALGLAFALRRVRDSEAFTLGVLPVFMLLTATWYYYIALLLPLLFFADRIERPSRVCGLALLLVSSAPLWWLDHVAQWDYPTTFTASCLVGIALLYMTGLAAFESRPAEARQAGDAETASNGART